ncbi:MAG TPA: hypothetical protein VKS60_08105 [Stellaceae bacterium]|nr:hypothetical protein [Stellaceae bacterium]
MRVVVADTSPLHYLVLIGEIGLLPILFETVSVPETVRDELTHPHSPPVVRDWLSAGPAWLKVFPTLPGAALPLPRLDDGERAAIALALSLRADLVLMDDRRGVAAALAQGLETVGTIGLLDLAARRGLTDLAAGFARLKATNFRCRSEMLDALLTTHAKREI